MGTELKNQNESYLSIRCTVIYIFLPANVQVGMNCLNSQI